MREYTVIGNFIYNNNTYEVLIDEDEKYFFLKYNNGKEEYVTLKELIELTRIFNRKNDSLNIEDNKKPKKKRIIPKVLIGSLLVTVSLSLLAYINELSTPIIHAKAGPSITLSQELPTQQADNNMTEIISNSEEELSPTDEAVLKAFKDIEKEQENFKRIGRLQAGRSMIIYDSAELDEVFNNKKEDITYGTIRMDIKNNPQIPDKYKVLYLTLADNLEKKYPTLDLRIWHQNLQTLVIEETDTFGMKLKAASPSACACYRKDENKIYTVKDYDYVPGTWDYQVIMHEMCHPIKGGMFKIGDNKIRVNFSSASGHGRIIEEAMNSIFTVRSYDQNERDIAYQLQSNIVEIMIDSMDNYTLQDYIEHDIRYFEEKLNEQNDNNDAVRIIGLMELQYNDYHNDKIKVDPALFNEVYDYTAKMYYRKYITPGMSYEQALQIKNTFIDRLSFDVPGAYELDINHINEFFEQYCIEIGIKTNKTL